MGYALRSGLSYCSVAGRLLFLDIDRDRYFALAQSTETALRKLITQHPLDPLDELKVQALIDGGVIEIADTDHRLAPCTPIPPAETSLLDMPGSRGTTFGTVAACLSIAASLRRVKSRSLRENLEAAVAQRQDNGQANEEGLTRIAHNFHRASRLISTHDRCLPQSLAVMRAVAAEGCTAKLVLGVILGPFAAHCWVQHDRVVVNDRVDRVRCYTPILVV